MDITQQQKRNSFNILTTTTKSSSQKYSTLELSPRIATKSIKKIVNEIVISDVLKPIIKDCSTFHIISNQSSNYQIDISTRKQLLDKISKVIVKCNYTQSTYYYTVYLMDLIYLRTKGNSSSSNFNLTIEEMAIGSLFLSSKFNEDFLNVSSLKSLISILEPNLFYSLDHLRRIEIICLKILDYDIGIVTPYIALELLFLKGVVFTSDNTTYDSIKSLKTIISSESRKLLEIIIRKSSLYVLYNPFLLAISIISHIREKNGLKKWNEMFNILYSINEDAIKDSLLFIEEDVLGLGLEGPNQQLYTERIQSCYKKKEIKVNTSIKITKIPPICIPSSNSNSNSNRQSTIEPYSRKSQRSTSASLDDTTSGRYNTKIQSHVNVNVNVNKLHYNKYNNSNLTKSNNKSANQKDYKRFSYKPIPTCSSLDKSERKKVNIKNKTNSSNTKAFAQQGNNSNNRPNIFQKNNIILCRKNSVLIRPSVNIENPFSLTTINNYNHNNHNKDNSSSKKKTLKANDTTIQCTRPKYQKITYNKINQLMMKRIEKRISESLEKHNSHSITLKESINQSFKNLNTSSEYMMTKIKPKRLTPYFPLVFGLTNNNNTKRKSKQNQYAIK